MLDRQTGPSTRRRQLHILYLLNDLLHHTKYHLKQSSVHSTLTENVQSHLLSLVSIVSAYDRMKFRNHRRRIDDLLDLWVEKSYFSTLFVQKLRETVEEPPKTSDARYLGQSHGKLEQASGGQEARAPYLMPSTHGDSLTPYYDLPAANMMLHIIPNSATPINPQLLKPLQLTAGIVEESLANALKKFMDEVDPRTNTELNAETRADIDELGNRVIRDATTGELIGGEGYYGWSRVFCEKMKMKHDGTEHAMERLRRDESSRSLSPHKRRRYSYSENSRDWERSRSRSTTASRSDLAGQPRSSHHGLGGRSSSRSRSRGNRLPRYKNREYDSSRARSRSRSPRSRSYSPNEHESQPPTTLAAPPPARPAQRFSPTPPTPSYPHAFNQRFLSGPGGLPIPPPRPPNYQGPWPPPPPPLPSHHTNLTSVGNIYTPFPPFGPQHPMSYEYAGQGQPPMHGAWGHSQPQAQHQLGRSENYSYPNPASIPLMFSGPDQNDGARTNRTASPHPLPPARADR